MKFLFLFILFFQSFAGATEVGSQFEQIARRRVMLAAELVNPAIYSCVTQASECQIEQTEFDLLVKIYQEMAALKKGSLIQFKSSLENPGLFDLQQGSHRMAVTTKSPGSPIYFNSDLIDPMQNNVRLSQFISLLVHEGGHHLGMNDDEEHRLDQLGNKVAKIFERNLQRIQGEGPDRENLEILVYNQIPSPALVSDWKSDNYFSLPLIHVTDGLRILSIDAVYPYLLDCFYGSFVKFGWVTDLHWKEDQVIAGQGVHYCQSGDAKLAVQESYFLNLNLSKDASGIFRIGPLPSQQIIEIPLLDLSSNLSYSHLLSMEHSPSILEILPDPKAEAQVTKGNDWSVSFLVKGDAKNYDHCTLLISSDEFDLRYPTGQKFAIESSREKCQIERAGSGRIRIRAQHTFHPETIQRSYYLKSVILTPNANQKVGFGVIIPKNRLEGQVGTKAQDPNARVTKIAVNSKGEVAQEPTYGFVPYELCKRLDFSFDLPGNSPVKQVHLKYAMFYRNDVYTPIVLTERLTENRNVYWDYESKPKAGGGVSVNIPSSLWQEFMLPEEVVRIEFQELWVQTEALEEYHIRFHPGQFGLETNFRFQACEFSDSNR